MLPRPGDKHRREDTTNSRQNMSLPELLSLWRFNPSEPMPAHVHTRAIGGHSFDRWLSVRALSRSGMWPNPGASLHFRRYIFVRYIFKVSLSLVIAPHNMFARSRHCRPRQRVKQPRRQTGHYSMEPSMSFLINDMSDPKPIPGSIR